MSTRQLPDDVPDVHVYGPPTRWRPTLFLGFRASQIAAVTQAPVLSLAPPYTTTAPLGAVAQN